MELIQRTAGSIKATNEYLFDLLDKIKAKEQFDFDIKMEIIFVTDENVCFSFTGDEKIYRYIYTPDDKGELTFAEEREDDIYSFASVTTNIITKDFSDKSIKNDLKKNKVSIEEVKANMQDVFVTTKQAHDKPVTFFKMQEDMNMTIEEIRKLIASKESVIKKEEAELYKLKTEYREAVKRKFTEDTGISEGDKFECTTTYKDNVGIEYTNKICGFFMGFGFDWLNTFSLIYREVGDDNAPSSVIRDITICAEGSYEFRKLKT